MLNDLPRLHWMRGLMSLKMARPGMMILWEKMIALEIQTLNIS